MPSVPLGVNAYKRSAGFVPEVRLVNMYLEPDKSSGSPDNVMRIGRPGLTIWNELEAIPRGIFHQDGLYEETYAIAGTILYYVAESSYTEIDDVGGTGRIAWGANYEHLFILSGATVYIYDGSTVAAVTMPDDREVIDLDVLNNYAILACPDGRFYWIVPGDNTVDPLNFATAESSPDGLVAVRVLGDEIIFFGVSRGEVWQPTGDSDLPFLRAAGRNFDRGCMSRDATLRFDNSVIWVGDDANVYRFGNIPEIISDNGIAQRIRQRTSLPSALIVEVDGHKHYVLKIYGQGSFGYDASTRLWCEFASSGETEWAPHISTQLGDGRWLPGYENQPYLAIYDPDSPYDATNPQERVVTGTIPIQGLAGRNDSVSIGIGASDDCTLKLRWKDGREDWPSVYEELEVRAPYDVVSMYRLGLPPEPFRSFELLIDEAVIVRISGMLVNEAWQ